jgi:hypothetical protein
LDDATSVSHASVTSPSMAPTVRVNKPHIELAKGVNPTNFSDHQLMSINNRLRNLKLEKESLKSVEEQRSRSWFRQGRSKVKLI